MIELSFNKKFNTRQEISEILGGDTQKGIAVSAQTNTILLFMNAGELYTDYFYPAGTYNYCMYTGIGRYGHQDSINNNMYKLTTLIISKKPGNTGISRDIRTEFTTDLLLSD